MFKMRGLVTLLAAVAMCFCVSGVAAEEVSKTFSHSLSIGNSAQSYEHRIDLPPNLAAAGKYFVSRNLKLDGKLVIEREELTRTYYYIKVRLPKATLWFAKGSVEVSLRAEKTTAIVPAPVAPTGLRVSGSNYAYFSWAGNEKYSAVSLFDSTANQTIWERVILDSNKCVMDEGYVRVGHRYVWAVKQAGDCGCYSDEAHGYFRVETRHERCRRCFGSGYITCRGCNGSGQIVVNGPNNSPVAQVCRQCNGTGKDRCMDCLGHGYNVVPVIVPEAP